MNQSSKARKVYMCGIDWQEESLKAPNAPEFFRTIRELKRKRKCWSECGILQLEMRPTKWVAKQDLFGRRK